MKTIETRYYHINGTPKMENANWETSNNYIEADVYYTQGGYSYFTYKNTPRGYFMSVSKIGRYKINDDTVMESRTMFSNDGARCLIKEVSRQSKKAETEAQQYFTENIEAYLKQIYPDLELEVA